MFHGREEIRNIEGESRKRQGVGTSLRDAGATLQQGVRKKNALEKSSVTASAS